MMLQMLIRFGMLAVVLILGGCTLPLVTFQDTQTGDIPKASSLDEAVISASTRDSERHERLHALGATLYVGVGNSLEEGQIEFFLRADNNHIVNATTGEIVGSVDPITKIGRWTLCNGKVHTFCSEFKGTVDGNRFGSFEIIQRTRDGKLIPDSSQ